MKKITPLLGLALFLLVSRAGAAPFQNGNFETGDFTSWGGDLVSSGTVDPDTDSHFSLFINPDPAFKQVALVTNDDTDWLATLYQDFTLDSLGPTETMDVSFWIHWEPTDSAQDSISAELSDVGYSETKDLLANISDSDLLQGTWVTIDITTFAQTWGGQEVELAFTVADGDWVAQDAFEVDNISFNRHPISVPEPQILMLLGAGLFGLFAGKRRRPWLEE